MSDLLQMLKPKTKAQSTTLFAWALIAPAAIYMFLIVVWPLVETFRLSFTNSNIGTLMEGHDYIGWANYEKALGGRKFPAIVNRTFYWMFLSVGLKIILGLIGATLLASNIRARGVIRALSHATLDHTYSNRLFWLAVVVQWSFRSALKFRGDDWYNRRTIQLLGLQEKRLLFSSCNRCLDWNADGYLILFSCHAGSSKGFV